MVTISHLKEMDHFFDIHIVLRCTIFLHLQKMDGGYQTTLLYPHIRGWDRAGSEKRGLHTAV